MAHKLFQLLEEWYDKGRKGGLSRLNSTCENSLDPDKLIAAEIQGTIGLFGKRK